MKKRNFSKLILFLFLTISCQVVVSQNNFVKYQDFELSYENDPDLHRLSKDFDLLFILLLDSSYSQGFFKYDPELEDSFNEYSHGMVLNRLTVGFATKHTDIKKIFDSKSKIMNCLFDDRFIEGKHLINYPVYIKNDTAIAEITTNNSISGIYFFRLQSGIVQINWLGEIIE